MSSKKASAAAQGEPSKRTARGKTRVAKLKDYQPYPPRDSQLKADWDLPIDYRSTSRTDFVPHPGSRPREKLTSARTDHLAESEWTEKTEYSSESRTSFVPFQGAKPREKLTTARTDHLAESEWTDKTEYTSEARTSYIHHEGAKPRSKIMSVRRSMLQEMWAAPINYESTARGDFSDVVFE